MSEVLRCVSVIVPCRNEAADIESFVANALSQILPAGWRMQLVVADGLSDDGTRESLQRMVQTDMRMLLVDNPGQIVSTGLNRALGISEGEVVVRMDVHTEYAKDYVDRCIAALEATAADNVGGAWRGAPKAGAPPMQHAIAAAFQSPAVAGGAVSRRLEHSGWADTVYLGAWPKTTFTRFGTFDESLVRNQDDEHNLRIVCSGGRIWQSADIHSVYRPRASLAHVFRQYLQYGYWKPFVMRKHGRAASWRHVVPALFVTALFSTLVVLACTDREWPVLLLLTSYLVAIAAMTADVARRSHPKLQVLVRVPVVIATYHLAYGLGSICGAWDAYVRRRARPRFGTLTR